MIHHTFDLSGRTALVTGSSRGLGRAAAEALAAAGARVIVNGVEPARIEATAEEIRANGYDVLTLPFDIANEAAVLAAFARLDEIDAAPDIVVNNAGINLRGPLLDLDSADWRKVLETNLTSAFLIGREGARRMIPRGQGKIINVASITSEIVRPTIGPYAAAKGGIKQLTKVMAAEWAPLGIQANGVGPGMMLTDMNRQLSEDRSFSEWLEKRVPARRWGDPAELGGPVVFLASAASDFVNGQMLYVDGGMTSVF